MKDGSLMDVYLISVVEIKSHGTMEITWISNGRLFDFHHGDRRLMELWKFDRHPLDVNFYVGINVILNKFV